MSYYLRPVYPTMELDDSEPPPMVEFDEDGEVHVSWEAHVSFEYDREWSHPVRAWGVPAPNFHVALMKEGVKAERGQAPAPLPRRFRPPKPKLFRIPWELRSKLSKPSRKPKRAIYRSPEALAQARADAEFMRHLGLFEQAQTHLAIYGLKE